MAKFTCYTCFNQLDLPSTQPKTSSRRGCYFLFMRQMKVLDSASQSFPLCLHCRGVSTDITSYNRRARGVLTCSDSLPDPTSSPCQHKTSALVPARVLKFVEEGPQWNSSRLYHTANQLLERVCSEEEEFERISNYLMFVIPLKIEGEDLSNIYFLL